MFSLFDLHFGLWSLGLRVLRTQRILGFFLIVITHKSTRSENPTTWLCFGLCDFLTAFFALEILPLMQFFV